MSTRDERGDDERYPDSAMASGSDAGEPGEHLGPAELRPDEQRLLDALERGRRDTGAGAEEDSDAVVRAAEDEAPLPEHGGQQDDGLSVVFDPPEEG